MAETEVTLCSASHKDALETCGSTVKHQTSLAWWVNSSLHPLGPATVKVEHKVTRHHAYGDDENA